MATKKSPAKKNPTSKFLYCAGCGKKRKFAYIRKVIFGSGNLYQCPYCGRTKEAA